jgi:Flp pilus assembly protein TadD
VHPRALAAAVKNSAICEELAAGLTDWSIVRFNLGGVQDPLRIPLLAAAKLADPDEWRDRMRQSWTVHKLVEMATNAPLDELPATTLYMFIEACKHQGVNNELAQDKMRQIQRWHASDFWINHALAHFFANTQPPQLDEAIRYGSVAVSLRPHAAAAHNTLGTLLLRHGRRSEALAEFRRTLQLAPDLAIAKSNMAKAMADSH